LRVEAHNQKSSTAPGGSVWRNLPFGIAAADVNQRCGFFNIWRSVGFAAMTCAILPWLTKAENAAPVAASANVKGTSWPAHRGH
jgi:hypothetical protein